MLRTLCLSMVLFVAAASHASAQVCAGGTAFSDRPLQVGAGFGFNDAAQTFGASFGGGTDTGFGLVGVSGLTLDGVNDTAVTLAATMGADPAIGASGRVRVCPVGTISYTLGPELFGVDTSTLGLQIGGQVGVIVAESAVMQLVPTFGLRWAHERLNLRMPAPFEDETVTDNYGIAALGMGFVFNRSIALTPQVSIPLRTDDEDPWFSLGLTVNF